MTMADAIAVMNQGRIEQLGTPSELYERPRTAYVAGFLGVSNLLLGRVVAPGRVRLDAGPEVQVAADSLDGRSGRVAVGIRPEKIRVGPAGTEENRLDGTISERSYVGVSTQFIVQTKAGEVVVYVQNAEPEAAAATPGQQVSLSWRPHSTFVVDPPEEGPE